MFRNFDLGKYRSIVISIALFILLDASVLGLNFYLSFGISDDANAVNLAGRQRMLSQRMVKSLYGTAPGQSSNASFDELKKTMQLFDQTLIAFDQGGDTTGASNQSVRLKAVSTSKGRESIDQARAIWAPLKTQLLQLLTAHEQNNQLKVAQLRSQVLRYAEDNNLSLLTLMNDLTVELEQVAGKKASTLRTIQAVGISLAILNFLFILFHFIRQLSDTDKKIDAARKETAEILDTVQEGLFLIDKQGKIGSQHSRQLENIIGVPALSGQKLSDVLAKLITPKDLATAQKFIDVLFDKRVVAKLIGSLNPLEKIQINVPNLNGDVQSRHLRFAFARVIEDDEIQHILITVTDITREVKLQQQLEASQSEGEQQLEMLTTFLHTSPGTLQQFLKNTRKSLQNANDVLKKPLRSGGNDTEGYREKVGVLQREIHRVKGDASALGFEGFVSRAHEFETELATLSATGKLGGNDFLPLTMRLEKLFSYTDSVTQLADRLSNLQRPESTTPQQVNDQEWGHLYQLTDAISQETGKRVELVLVGLHEHRLNDQYRNLVNDVCIQLIRNAVVHGIEDAGEREAANKAPTGRIEIKLAETKDGKFELSVRDDGRGIDFERIRSFVIGHGIASEEEIAAWTNKKLFSMIFRPEFSTMGEVSEHAGRGVGMNVILQEIQQANGQLKTLTRKGSFCQFQIVLPPATPAPEASKASEAA